MQNLHTPALPSPTLWQRRGIMTYSLVVYLCSVAALVYMMGFILDVAVPRTLSQGPSRPVMAAVLGNLGLLSLFGLQHSVMARPAFKRWLCRAVPEAAERSTYCLATALVLAVLFMFWSPIDGVVWSTTAPWAVIGLRAVACLGFGILLLASFQLNHFELFGLQQGWRSLRGKDTPPPKFRMPALYAHVRHPIYFGMLIAMWSTANMTMGHLLFAGVSTAYILVGSTLEEADLAKSLGSSYEDYQRKVSRLIPVRSLFRGGASASQDT